MLLAGLEDTERPWIKPHVHTPAAQDPEPGATRRRPLIYIYELPAIFNTHMLQVGWGHAAGQGMPVCLAGSGCAPSVPSNLSWLQYRTEKWQCVHRLWVGKNESLSHDANLYQIEPGAPCHLRMPCPAAAFALPGSTQLACHQGGTLPSLLLGFLLTALLQPCRPARNAGPVCPSDARCSRGGLFLCANLCPLPHLIHL